MCALVLVGKNTQHAKKKDCVHIYIGPAVKRSFLAGEVGGSKIVQSAAGFSLKFKEAVHGAEPIGGSPVMTLQSWMQTWSRFISFGPCFNG